MEVGKTVIFDYMFEIVIFACQFETVVVFDFQKKGVRMKHRFSQQVV